jgi:hypothetical protein
MLISRQQAIVKLIDMEDGESVIFIKHSRDEFELINGEDQKAKGKHRTPEANDI